MKIERVDTVRCGLGEGAVWDAEGQALFFLDIWGRKIFRHDPACGETQVCEVPGHVGAMALGEGGSLLLGMKDALCRLDFASGACEQVAGPVFSGAGVTINDGAADRAGRFVFGGCCEGIDNPRAVGGLFGFDGEGGVTRLDEGVTFSNSHCFSPDGATLYAADSFLHTLYAYDYDLGTGAVANRRVFANTAELGGLPDGSAVDADGTVWVSVFEAGRIAAFRSDGRLERVIDMPVKLISSVAFGGPALDVLYVTTIDPTQFGRDAEEGSGHVYAVSGLGVRGLPEPRAAMRGARFAAIT